MESEYDCHLTFFKIKIIDVMLIDSIIYISGVHNYSSIFVYSVMGSPPKV